MRKTTTITINDRIITINELTIKQLMGLKESFSGDMLATVQHLLPMLTDATPEFLQELAPSELFLLYDKIKEVNAAFFTLIPLDRILAGYHDTMIERIQANLQKLSAGLSVPDMDQPSMNTA